MCLTDFTVLTVTIIITCDYQPGVVFVVSSRMHSSEAELL